MLLVIIAIVLYSSEYSAFVLPIAGIVCLLGILALSLKLKAKEYATIATAPERAKELLALGQSYQLQPSTKVKTYALIGATLIPALLLFYLYKQFGWPIFFGIVFSIYLTYAIPKLTKFIESPIIEVNQSGITHYFSGTIPWKYIAGVSLSTIYGRTKSHPKFYIHIDLYDIGNFKANFSEIKKVQKHINKYNLLSLPLVTDEFNANVALEFTKSYARKMKAPLIRSKHEQLSQLGTNLGMSKTIDEANMIAETITKISSEINNHFDLKTQIKK